MRLPTNRFRGTRCGCMSRCWSRCSSFLIRRLWPSSLFGVYDRTMLPSRSSVTRLSGSGRSSDVSQKSSECLAMMSSVMPGTIAGAPADSAIGVQLADERDVPHRVLELVVAEVEVVHAERLLKHGRVRRLRDGQQHRIHVPHVVTADDARRVGQAVGVTIVGRSQQQRRRIDGAARRHDDVAGERSPRAPLRWTATPVTSRPEALVTQARDAARS